MQTKVKYLDELSRMLLKKDDPYDSIKRELGHAVGEYRRKWALSGRGELELLFPLHLNVELTYGCNLKCEFCMFSLPRKEWKYTPKPGDKIPFEKYCQIIDEGVAHGLCSVALNGYNEPLLQKDISRFIKYARNAGVLDISLHTNGILMTDELSMELIDSGLTIMMFSIDAATAKTYKEIRKSESYDKVVNNILRFLELRKKTGKTLPLARVSFVENKINYKELDDFVSFWKDKADFFMIQSFANPFINNGKYSEAESKFRLKDTPFKRCSEPYQRLTILCDGTVLPCCSYYGMEIVVGNIYKDSVLNIWNSKQMKEMRLRVNAKKQDQPQACQKCRVSVLSKKDNQGKN